MSQMLFNWRWYNNNLSTACDRNQKAIKQTQKSLSCLIGNTELTWVAGFAKNYNNNETNVILSLVYIHSIYA